MDIAVVVQSQVNSTRAGVMFTVNPATGERGELVIEGSFGLGEAVVSGSVSPDRYVVEKATLAIRRREVHHKDLVVEYPPEGGTSQRTLRGGRRAAGTPGPNLARTSSPVSGLIAAPCVERAWTSSPAHVTIPVMAGPPHFYGVSRSRSPARQTPARSVRPTYSGGQPSGRPAA